jgi:signal transduction histidine kinase/CheY-like chemotaxis protein
MFLTHFFNDEPELLNDIRFKSTDTIAADIIRKTLQLSILTFQNDTVNQVKINLELAAYYYFIDQKLTSSDYYSNVLKLTENQKDKTIYNQALDYSIFISELLQTNDYTIELLKKKLRLSESVVNNEEVIKSFSAIIRHYLDLHLLDKADLYYLSLREFLNTEKPISLPLEVNLQLWRLNRLKQIDNQALIIEEQIDRELSLSKKPLDYLAYCIYRFDNKLLVTKDIESLKILFPNLKIESDHLANSALNEMLAGYLLELDIQKSLQHKYLALQSFGKSATVAAKRNIVITGLLADQVLTDKIKTEFYAKSKQQSESKIGFILLIIISFFILVFFIYMTKKNRKTSKFEIQNLNIQLIELKKQFESDKTELDDLVIKREEQIKLELLEFKKLDFELKDALKKAEEANYLKNAFLSNMSHEIRTPLNGILNFSSLLEVELAIIEEPELYEYANSIQKSGEKLLHLLNNIIDISRFEANDMELKLINCNIASIAETAVNEHIIIAKQKGINIISDFTKVPDVQADIDTLARVLSELIDNAVKFTDKGYVKVGIHYIHESNQVEISIIDTGVGIDKSYLPQIFEAFRHDSLGYTRQYQGAGLGLPLAQRMTQLMGGEFHIESEKGVGTVIRLKLKISGLSEQSAVPKNVIKKTNINFSLKGKKVFVVEDDHSNMLVISKLLGNDSELFKAYDGDEALKIVSDSINKGFLFDLMLFDINLPAPWDGIKLMHFIKEKYPQYQKVPFIAQTAYAMMGDRDRFIEAGFTEYMAKPIRKEQLFESISKVLF